MRPADLDRQRLDDLLRTTRTEPVPPELHARLERDFAAHVSRPDAGPGAAAARDLAARVWARVAFDSALAAGTAGARGAGATRGRQLVLTVEGLEIAFDAGATRAGRAPVRVQLLPLDDGPAEDVDVTVWDRFGARVSVSTDAGGEADLGVLSTGEVVLEVDGARGRWPIAQAVLDLDVAADEA